MKRLLSLILCVCLTAGMIVLPVQAEEPKFIEKSQEDIALMQRAVVETGLAYYHKGASVDYDYASMTIRDRKTVGVAKMHAGAAPELASRDFILNAHCADWINTVYMNALDHIVGPSIWEAFVRSYNIYKSVNEPDVVLKYGGDGLKDRDEFAQKARELLQPGDIWSASGDPDYANGHTMLYIGDYKGDGEKYVIHCSGKPSDETTGDPAKDTGIKIDTIEHFFRDDKGWSIYHEDYIQHVTIMRPINILTVEDITPSALVRVQYPLMTVDRYSDAFGYSSVMPGQEVRVTLTVENKSASDYQEMTIFEPQPQGGFIVPESPSNGGIVDRNGVTWNLVIPAGQKLQLTYTVAVTAPRGDTLYLPAGSVGGLPTRELSHTVAGYPVTEKLLDALDADVLLSLLHGENVSETAFANAVYRKVLGVELGLPETMQEVLDNAFGMTQLAGAGATGGYMLIPLEESQRTEAGQKIYDMLLPDHMAGRVVLLEGVPDSYYPLNRVTSYMVRSYAPGDVFLCLEGSKSTSVTSEANVSVYVYLGSSRVATMEKGDISIKSFSATIEKFLRMGVVLGLRPTLAHDQIMLTSTVAPEEAKTPAVPEAPVWPEPEVPEVPEIPEVPEESEVPAQPETPAEPVVPAEPVAPAEPETPAGEESFSPAFLIPVAAAVVIAVAAVVAVKKKKQ